MVLVGGRLYALAHGVRQKFAHFGVAAGAAVRGVDAAEVERLDASGQRRCEAAAFALCDDCAAGGASGGGGDRVNHESAVLITVKIAVTHRTQGQGGEPRRYQHP